MLSSSGTLEMKSRSHYLFSLCPLLSLYFYGECKSTPIYFPLGIILNKRTCSHGPQCSHHILETFFFLMMESCKISMPPEKYPNWVFKKIITQANRYMKNHSLGFIIKLHIQSMNANHLSDYRRINSLIISSDGEGWGRNEHSPTLLVGKKLIWSLW